MVPALANVREGRGTHRCNAFGYSKAGPPAQLLRSSSKLRVYVFAGRLSLLSLRLPWLPGCPGSQTPPDLPGTARALKPPDRQIFKARAEVVSVPVVVRNKQSQPVTGLKQEAFQIEENGKSGQCLLSKKLLQKRQSPFVSAPDGYSNIPLDASLNTHVTIVVLDLDDRHPGEIQRTDGKERLARFFSTTMPKGEPVSLLCLTKDGVKMVHPFFRSVSAREGAG